MASRTWTITTTVRSTCEVASHLGFLAGLYVTSATLCIVQLVWCTQQRIILALAFSLCTATAAYLLDRVKLRDSWLDPADAVSHPHRYSFISRHTHELRLSVTALLFIATCLGYVLHPWLTVAPLFAALGVLIYASHPRRKYPRPKDRFILKNVYVALSITVFAGLVAHASCCSRITLDDLHSFHREKHLSLIVASIYLFVRVFADAALCDIDDEIGDRRFSTRTLPVRIGRQRTLVFAYFIRLAAACWLVVALPLPLTSRLIWAGACALSTIAMWIVRPSRIRDWIDISLVLEACSVVILLAILSHD